MSGLAGATGILGGTFDPVHRGHVAVATQCLEQLELAEVRLVPSFLPPHREPPAAPAADRLAMTRLAAEGLAGLHVDDLEIRRGGVSYTFDTLEELQARGLRRLVLLLGHDAAVEVGSWHRGTDLGGLAEIVVFNRTGAHDAGGADRLPAGARSVEVDSPDVSATEVRQRLEAGLDASDLVPASVLEYIIERNLYGSGDGGRRERAVIIPPQ